MPVFLLLIILCQDTASVAAHTPTRHCQALLSSQQLAKRSQLERIDEADFRQRFRLGHRLGGGSSGFVVSATDAEASNAELAMKFVRLTSPFDRQRLFAELSANRLLGRHRGALLLNDSCAALLTPQHRGGSLREALNRLQSQRGSNATAVSAESARQFSRALLRQLRRLHSLGLVHADLKPENIVLDDPQDFASLTVVDFGSVIADGVATVRTPAYSAPELPGVPTPEADVWSAGRIIREVIVGYRIDSPASQGRSPKSRLVSEFLAQLTRLQPSERLSARDALRHSWFRSTCQSGSN